VFNNPRSIVIKSQPHPIIRSCLVSTRSKYLLITGSSLVEGIHRRCAPSRYISVCRVELCICAALCSISNTRQYTARGTGPCLLPDMPPRVPDPNYKARGIFPPNHCTSGGRYPTVELSPPPERILFPGIGKDQQQEGLS